MSDERQRQIRKYNKSNLCIKEETVKALYEELGESRAEPLPSLSSAGAKEVAVLTSRILESFIREVIQAKKNPQDKSVAPSVEDLRQVASASALYRRLGLDLLLSTPDAEAEHFVSSWFLATSSVSGASATDGTSNPHQVHQCFSRDEHGGE